MAENATFRVTAQKTTDLSELVNDAELLELWGMADTTAIDIFLRIPFKNVVISVHAVNI